MVHTFILISIFWVCYFIGLTLGWLIPEKLVKPFGLFDIFPFNCRKCCTTWTLVAVYSTYLFLCFNWVVFGASIFITAATAYCIYKTEKDKTVEYEYSEDSMGHTIKSTVFRDKDC